MASKTLSVDATIDQEETAAVPATREELVEAVVFAARDERDNSSPETLNALRNALADLDDFEIDEELNLLEFQDSLEELINAAEDFEFEMSAEFFEEEMVDGTESELSDVDINLVQAVRRFVASRAKVVG